MSPGTGWGKCARGSLTVKYPGPRGRPHPSPLGPPSGRERKYTRGPHTGLPHRAGCRLCEVGVLAEQDSHICAHPSRAVAQKHPALKRKGLGRGEFPLGQVTFFPWEHWGWKGSSGYGIHFFSTHMGTVRAWNLPRVTQQVSG